MLKNMNKTALEAYVLANIHVVRLSQAVTELPELKQPFFYQCLAAETTVARGGTMMNPEFVRSLALYNSWREFECEWGDRTFILLRWCQNASRQMATNASNTVNLNFYWQFHKYLKR